MHNIISSELKIRESEELVQSARADLDKQQKRSIASLLNEEETEQTKEEPNN